MFHGLREKLQESLIFNGKIGGFRLRFVLKPIHKNMGLLGMMNDEFLSINHT